jgi:hypothetical protein
MKTLKQIFDNFCNSRPQCPAPDVDDSCGTCMLDAVKEWLQHKLDAIPDRMEYYHSNEPEQMQTLGKVKFGKALLEELE